VADVGDRAAVAISRSITRRKFLSRGMRAGLVTGVALSGPLAFFEGRAEAANCSKYGHVSTWGCTCASTPSCSGCSGGNCAGSLRKRCNYWTQPNSQSQYCWCSLTCCVGANHTGCYGYYTCCDCWTGGSGTCSQSGGHSTCICKSFVQTGCCDTLCRC
jgi:hypothetical protein